MKRVFVDTSAWFAYVRRDDPDHDAVVKVLTEWEGRLVTSNFIFDEVVTLVRFRLGHAAAAKVGETLKDPETVDLIQLLPEDEEDAWAWFVRHQDKDYSYTDCTSFALMRRLHIGAAVAVDQHFRQAGFQIRPDS